MHRSSPLASQGFICPAGLHRSEFPGKGLWGGKGPPKKVKTTIQEVTLFYVLPPLGLGGGNVIFALFHYWPNQEMETLMHEQC